MTKEMDNKKWERIKRNKIIGNEYILKIIGNTI